MFSKHHDLGHIAFHSELLQQHSLDNLLDIASKLSIYTDDSLHSTENAK